MRKPACAAVVTTWAPTGSVEAFRLLVREIRGPAPPDEAWSPGGYSPAPTTSNGVRELDELPLESEAVRESFRERLHAEPFGRVVTGGDEGDAELTREVEARLLRLAGKKDVTPGRGR